MNPRSNRYPEIGKFKTARCVEAPYSAESDTSMAPMESCSMREDMPPRFANGSGGGEGGSEIVGHVVELKRSSHAPYGRKSSGNSSPGRGGRAGTRLITNSQSASL